MSTQTEGLQVAADYLDDRGFIEQAEYLRNRAVPKRNIGIFYISQELIEEADHSKLSKVMSNFVIIRAEQRFDLRSIEYIAYSPLFAQVEEAMKYPTYDIVVDSEGNVSVR